VSVISLSFLHGRRTPVTQLVPCRPSWSGEERRERVVRASLFSVKQR